MVKPKYLYRPHDKSVLKLQENGRYKFMSHPDTVSLGYTYEVLISHDFKPCTEEDFPRLKREQTLYYDFVSWQGRNDGHGGCKGGTMEEYFVHLKRVRDYEAKKEQNDFASNED